MDSVIIIKMLVYNAVSSQCLDNSMYLLYRDIYFLIYVACQTGNLRLQGSSIQGRGRVEVCIGNVWGTICDNLWNSADASVVCKQLGYSRFGKFNMHFSISLI